jgi:hypothetical protein
MRPERIMGLDIQDLLMRMAGEEPANSRRPDDVRELARNWSSDTAMLEWIARRTEFRSESFVRKLAEQELFVSREKMSGTLTWLMRRAFFEREERIRRDALVEIIRGWGQRPALRAWVMKMVEEEESRHVKETVLEQIMRMEHLDGKTRQQAEERLACCRRVLAKHWNLGAGIGRGSCREKPEPEQLDPRTGPSFSNN